MWDEYDQNNDKLKSKLEMKFDEMLSLTLDFFIGQLKLKTNEYRNETKEEEQKNQMKNDWNCEWMCAIASMR